MNRVLYADDCLNVLRDPLAIPPQSVDLIYLDPPFNSKSEYNLPFKLKDKSAKPVTVFEDTWRWNTPQDDDALARLRAGPATKPVAHLIDIARQLEGPTTQYRLDAYLVNMAVRLIAMKGVLKPTGSIYLHCDPTAGHYLKALMDLIFGRGNFRNEIVWCYTGPGSPGMRQFNRKHDTIFWYSIGETWTFNADAVRLPHVDGGPHAGGFVSDSVQGIDAESSEEYGARGKIPETWWSQQKGNGLAIVPRQKTQYLGYPTQKPLALLERIIEASSNPGDLVLDPFCGCGTSIHAAEKLGRRWIGVDVSKFSAGLIRARLTTSRKKGEAPLLAVDDIQTSGIPETPEEARELANRDKFEFEKCMCGLVGAEGMFHEPGTKGADGGVDGVLKFYPLRWGQKPSQKEPDLAIVQVKGGKVTPDAVRALDTTVRHYEATAGVIICFEQYMRTVENNRETEHFETATGAYPRIQGLSVEAMLRGAEPNLPNLMRKAA